MKRIILSVIAIIYLVISILMTSYLLHYNDYNISQFDDTSYVTLKDKKGSYNAGSLLKIKKSIFEIKEGDGLFYYNTYNTSMEVEYGTVQSVEKISDTEVTYMVENGNYLSSQYILGGTGQTSSYPLGSIVDFLASRWGYLFTIVLPILVVFIYELYALIRELIPKKNKRVNKEVPHEETQKETE